MRHSLTLIAASAAFSWLGAGAMPHRFRRRAAPQIPGYEFTGCYTEATNARALTGSAYFNDLMTVEKCAYACAEFKYFGIEYGRECYCGNNINDGSVEAQLADCSFACPGDSTESCGAGNRLTLYTRTTDPEVPTLTTYTSRGCYAEPPNGRALVAQVTRAADMTVEQCATFCGNAGYTLFGLEYYTECYCGNVLTPGSEPADAADCRYPCAGNSAELCGGDWRLNLYEFGADSSSVSTSTTASAPSVPTADPTASYTSEGCYTEAQGIRALGELAYYDDAMTVEKCAAACVGYAWFGIEYGRECYGGNTIHSAEGSVLTSLSECSFPCPGNPAQKCGAGDRLNVYRYLPQTPPASTSSDSPVETSTSTITTAADASATSTDPPSDPASDPTSTSMTDAAATSTTDAAATATTDPASDRASTSTTDAAVTATTDPVSNAASTLTTDLASDPASTSTTDATVTSTTDAAATATTDPASDPASKSTTDSTSTTDLASTSTTDLASSSTTDPASAESTTSGSVSSTEASDSTSSSAAIAASTSTTDVASTSTTDAASTSTTDAASTSTTDAASTSTTDVASTSTTDVASTSTTDVASMSTVDPTFSAESTTLASVSSTEASDSTSSSSTDSPISTSVEVVQVTSTSTTVVQVTEISTTVVQVTTSTSTSSAATSTSTSSASTSSTATSTSTASTATSTSTFSTVISTSTSATSSTSSTTTSTSTLTTAVQVTTSTTTSSTAAASPTNAIANGDFEHSSSAWTVKTSSSSLTYSFVNTASPHGGARAASVAYASGASSTQAWFNQAVTLKANTKYNFSGWAKASNNNPGCSVTFYLGNTAGTSLATLSQVASNSLKTTWTQTTGSYTTTSTTAYTFNVKWTCTGSSARTYYVDDLSLIAA